MEQLRGDFLAASVSTPSLRVQCAISLMNLVHSAYSTFRIENFKT